MIMMKMGQDDGLQIRSLQIVLLEPSANSFMLSHVDVNGEMKKGYLGGEITRLHCVRRFSRVEQHIAFRMLNQVRIDGQGRSP